MKRPIHIYIDKIVLDGPMPGNPRAFRAAIQEKLGGLIREQGLPVGDHVQPYYRTLPGGTLPPHSPARPEPKGESVARGIYQGLKHLG